MTKRKSNGNVILWPNAEKLQNKIDEYFDECETPTLHSLFYYLGITRQNFYDWKTGRPDDYKILLKAKERVVSILTEIIAFGSNHPLIRKHEIDGKQRFIDARSVAWYLKNIAIDEFSDNPNKIEELRQESRITLSLENHGTNKVWEEQKKSGRNKKSNK